MNVQINEAFLLFHILLKFYISNPSWVMFLVLGSIMSRGLELTEHLPSDRLNIHMKEPGRQVSGAPFYRGDD